MSDAFDLSYLNDDVDFRCYDGDRHDFRDVGGKLECRRGCGAEIPLDTDGSPNFSINPLFPDLTVAPMITPRPVDQPAPSAPFDADTDGEYVCPCGQMLFDVHPEDRALTGAKLCPVCDRRALMDALRENSSLRVTVRAAEGEVPEVVRQLANARVSFDPGELERIAAAAAQAVTEPGEHPPVVGQAWVYAPGQSEPQQVRLRLLD